MSSIEMRPFRHLARSRVLAHVRKRLLGDAKQGRLAFRPNGTRLTADPARRVEAGLGAEIAKRHHVAEPDDEPRGRLRRRST